MGLPTAFSHGLKGRLEARNKTRGITYGTTFFQMTDGYTLKNGLPLNFNFKTYGHSFTPNHGYAFLKTYC